MIRPAAAREPAAAEASDLGLVPDPDAVRLIPRAMALRYRLVPIGLEIDRIRLAMTGTEDLEALDYVHMIARRVPTPIVVGEEALHRLMERAYGGGLEGETPELLAVEACRLLSRSDQDVADMPVVRLFDLLLAEAVRKGATDLHLQPEEHDLLARLRIDGVLHTAHRLAVEVAPALAARIKILAGLDIAERRAPQDGKIAVTLGNRPIDLRVSTLACVHGECVVLRILDHSRVATTFSDLGMDEGEIDKVRRMLERPHGVLLVTGPTGSGKTTTLYACLRSLDSAKQNILTLEDPVEYRLPGIRQSQIHERAGLTFASGLRAMLRQDPDAILVGEMRDHETVETAMRAALTGHLVLSTLHTNSAVGALTRLREMGVEDFLLASCLVGVVAQRLARRVCRGCATEFEASEAEKRALGLDAGESIRLARGTGCDSCHGTGYAGRFAVCEALSIDGPIATAIASGKSEGEILDLARGAGFRTIRETLADRVRDRETAIDELTRLTI